MPDVLQNDQPPPESPNPFAKPADESDTSLRPSPLTESLPWVAAVLTVALLACVNLIAVPFAENMRGPPDGLQLVVFAVGLGLLGGQISGLSSVLVWSRGPFLVRLVVLWGLGMVLFACWCTGLVRIISRQDWLDDHRIEIARMIGASLPLISLAVQLPQWLARSYFGWRIEPAGASEAKAQSLSIRDILTGTVVAALTITAARLSPEAANMEDAFWIAWAIAVGILAAVSALVMLPLVVLILRGWHAIWAILYIVLGSPILAGTTMYLIVLVDGQTGGPDERAVAAFLIAATSCVATTSAPLWLARFAGYRLKMGREA